METIAVIDFETTGMSPDQGARATEIAAVLVRDGRIINRYQSLMQTDAYIPAFIQELTGITHTMVRDAPPAEQVMREVAQFVGSAPLLAHNAAFDRKFWDAELSRAGGERRQDFACSLLLSRRLYPEAPSHRLGALVEHLHLPSAGRHHRALADAEMTAHLLLAMEDQLLRRFELRQIPHELLCAIGRTPRRNLAACVERFRTDADRRPVGRGFGR